MTFLGTIMLWAGDFAPRGWAFCHGQKLEIRNYSALFSLLGNTYGGEKEVSFCLPDLRGRVPVGVGHADGLSNYTLGKIGGAEKVSLSTSEMPAHNHQAKMQVASPLKRGTQTDEVANNYLGTGNSYASEANNSMAPDAISMEEAGQGTAHENRQPYIPLNYIICMSGVLPASN